jgi:regulator of sigma E protease
MGPVGIISVSYTIADTSLIHYLYFLGLLSSILAVMNLLPLPVLDGGVILMLVIEKIIGRPINEKVQAAVTYAGLALILALMLLVTYNDILRILFG